MSNEEGIWNISGNYFIIWVQNLNYFFFGKINDLIDLLWPSNFSITFTIFQCRNFFSKQIAKSLRI